MILLVFAAGFHSAVWSSTFFSPGRVVIVFSTSVITASPLLDPLLVHLPTGPMLPRHLLSRYPLARLVPLLATFLPGFALFYLRLSLPHWRRKPVVWSPALYSLGIASAVPVSWSMSSRVLLSSAADGPNTTSPATTAHALITGHDWGGEVALFYAHTVCFAVTYTCCVAVVAVLCTTRRALWARPPLE